MPGLADGWKIVLILGRQQQTGPRLHSKHSLFWAQTTHFIIFKKMVQIMIHQTSQNSIYLDFIGQAAYIFRFQSRSLTAEFYTYFITYNLGELRQSQTMINNYFKSLRMMLLNRYLHIYVIVVFEFFGTVIFSYCTINMVNLKQSGNSIYSKIVFFFLDFSISMMLVVSYGRQFSGGLFNPAVSFFRIFRKTQRYTVPIAILYMICQFSGGIVGCFLALAVNDVSHAPITTYLPWQIQIEHIVTDALGTMVLTFMVQLVSEKKMTYVEHNREFYLILPLYYLIARTYSSKSNGVNPAFGVGFELVYCYKHGTWGIFYQTYIFIVGPYLGAAIACFLFQFGMRPMYPIKKQAAIQAAVQMKRAKQEIQLKFTPKKLNNRWSLNEVLNEEKYIPLGNQYQFQAIAEEDFDDDIESLSDKEDQISVMPLQTQLERSIRKSTIVTSQFANKVRADLLRRRSLYQQSAKDGDNESNEDSNYADIERKYTFFKPVVNYSIMDNPSIQEAYSGENDGL